MTEKAKVLDISLAGAWIEEWYVVVEYFRGSYTGPSTEPHFFARSEKMADAEAKRLTRASEGRKSHGGSNYDQTYGTMPIMVLVRINKQGEKIRQILHSRTIIAGRDFTDMNIRCAGDDDPFPKFQFKH